MKRILFIGLLALITVFSLSAEAVGGGFSYGLTTGTGGGTFLFSVDPIPFTMVGVNVQIAEGSAHIGVTDDWWFFNEHLAGVFKLYMGVGFYAGFSTSGSTLDVDLGARVPIGLQAFVLDPLEIFIEAAPAAGMGLSPAFSFPNFGVQGLAGVRFWF